MAQTNHERVARALDLLRAGLSPFVEREMRAVHGEGWERHASTNRAGAAQRDAQALLATLWDNWNEVFRNILGSSERSLVSELRDWRNKWAHQERFSTDDAERALDSIRRLLTAIAAPQAQEVEQARHELLRLRFEEQARKEKNRALAAPTEGAPSAGLKPWRELVMPHPDVASGRYQNAEFAADLGKVHRGEAAAEYGDPTEFFHRTFLTEGLRVLLTNALRRLCSSVSSGDPVVELQTNFGGGKTHSMLALYHLVSGRSARELPGTETLLGDAGVDGPIKAHRAVLVGTALAPGQPHAKPDGTVIHTLWGELAYQLLGQEGYRLVAGADHSGTSPGSDALRTLFQKAAPCLILIDEWVAYARQLKDNGDLSGGTFESTFSFAQSLTEAAAAVPQTLVVVSIPASDIETGGERGREALARLRNVVGRVERAWRPATAEEGFEIVKRRLFLPITRPEDFVARDAVVRAFADMYRGNPQEFPNECRDTEYQRRVERAYPIHPELFDRLYLEWSKLDKFQQTRGVLRLMAAVIHTLWQGQDASLLIQPGMIPLNAVQSELMHYLDDPWAPVIERDVDGPSSTPLALDNENPNLGRYSACRRVARTIYIGSAPGQSTANRGLDDRHVRLGSVQPGETIPTFGDALRRLTDRAMHLYVDDARRYWYSTQPTVTRLAQDRAVQLEPEAVQAEIKRRLDFEQRNRGEFAAVHPCPVGPSSVPDERETRLAILGPEHSHVRVTESKAKREAMKLLEQKGTGLRNYRNAVVFLAPDEAHLQNLDTAVRAYLAWKSIYDEREALDLGAFQQRQSETKRDQNDDTVNQRIPETYQWLLVPGQGDPSGPTEWDEIRLTGQGGLAVRASNKLRQDGRLVTMLAGSVLRDWLDGTATGVSLWDSSHIRVKQLADHFARYPYLDRLKSPNVLVAAIQSGVALPSWEQDGFAYADRYDDCRSRYVGLRAGENVYISLDSDGLLVKPDVARRQMEAETVPSTGADSGVASSYPSASDLGLFGTSPIREPVPMTTPAPSSIASVGTVYRRFHGSVALSATRLSSEAAKVAAEIVQHLASVVGADIKITLEIQAELPAGATDQVVRTVTENCTVLHFRGHGFEEH